MSKSLRRQALYALAWSEPISKLSEQFRVSGVAIAKACRKVQVLSNGEGPPQIAHTSAPRMAQRGTLRAKPNTMPIAGASSCLSGDGSAE
jgi:hypothetical protein